MIDLYQNRYPEESRAVLISSLSSRQSLGNNFWIPVDNGKKHNRRSVWGSAFLFPILNRTKKQAVAFCDSSNFLGIAATSMVLGKYTAAGSS